MLTSPLGSLLGGLGVAGFGRGVGAAPPEPWYLKGGVNPANCVAAYKPKGAASLAASYVNIANPGTYDAYPGSAPTFDAAYGWFFNQGPYLFTGWIPANDQCSVLIRVAGFESWSGGYVYGSYTWQNLRHQIAPANPGLMLANGGTGTVTGDWVASGVIGFAGQQAYKDGVAFGAPTAGGNIPPTSTVIGGSGVDGAGAWPTWGQVNALVMYSIVLSAAQVAAISAAMAAL